MPSSYPILNNKHIDRWKVIELKEELKRRKLTTRGLKDELIKRLHDSICVELDALKQEEPPASLKQVPDQEGALHEQFPNPVTVRSKSVEKVLPEKQVTILENDPTTVSNDEQKSTTEVDAMTAVEELISSSEFTAPVEEVCCIVPVESNVIDKNTLQIELEPDGEDLVHIKTHDEEDRKSVKGIDEKSCEMNIEESKDLDYLKEDVSFNQSGPNNQVSEVKPDSGFPVNCESISTDSLTINQTNNLKDNLKTDDLNLELGVIKLEIVQQSSSDGAAIGDDLHSLDNIPEVEDKHGSSEEMVDAVDGSCEEHSKKNNSVEGERKVDMSSCDGSMGDDVVDSKQIESNVNLEVVEVRDVLEETRVEEEPVDEFGGFSPPNKDVAEDEGSILIPSGKRKHEGKYSPGINESPKRQKLWNTDILKSPKQHISSLASFSTPVNLGQSTPKQTFTTSNSNLSGDAQKERIVPPSQKTPTNSLRIDQFLRPFTLKAVQELLARTGTVCSLWMDNIKTHCYVTYSSEEEAVQTRNAVYNLQWPPNGGHLLTAEFVNPQEVKDHVEAAMPSPITPVSAQRNKSSPHSSRQRGQQLISHPPPPPPSTSSLSPPTKGKVAVSPQLKEPDPLILTLDNIFTKTKSTPRIYYLPLTQEQVSAKRAIIK